MIKRDGDGPQVPDGFEPVLNYCGDPAGSPVDGLVLLRLGDGDRPLEFEGGVPALPLRVHGELWSTGWDIPTRYAIDREGACWMDNAHGYPLQQVNEERLIGAPEHEHERNEIRRALGVELPMPEWAATAIRAGFQPPEGWTWTKR